MEVMASLPLGSKTHLTCPSHYHITVYMTSQPHTLRPNPFDAPHGGLGPGDGAEEIAAASEPEPSVLSMEVEHMREAAAATPRPQFEVRAVGGGGERGWVLHGSMFCFFACLLVFPCVHVYL
jgi:hypothetical protein